jgi:hypothetical protein
MNNQGKRNVKLIKSFYKALRERRFGTARALLDPDIEWVEPISEGLWFSGRHSGVVAVFKEVIHPAREKLEKLWFKTKKFFAVGDFVVVIGTFHGRATSTGIKLNIPAAHLWRFANCKVVRFEAFDDILEWRVVMGLKATQANRIAA